MAFPTVGGAAALLVLFAAFPLFPGVAVEALEVIKGAKEDVETGAEAASDSASVLLMTSPTVIGVELKTLGESILGESILGETAEASGREVCSSRESVIRSLSTAVSVTRVTRFSVEKFDAAAVSLACRFTPSPVVSC